jgi:hypothetical protein
VPTEGSVIALPAPLPERSILEVYRSTVLEEALAIALSCGGTTNRSSATDLAHGDAGQRVIIPAEPLTRHGARWGISGVRELQSSTSSTPHRFFLLWPSQVSIGTAHRAAWKSFLSGGPKEIGKGESLSGPALRTAPKVVPSAPSIFDWG